MTNRYNIRIVSGGQTGVDHAALDAAIEYDANLYLMRTISSDGALDAAYARDVYGRVVSASNGVAQTDYVLHENGIATNESWKVGTNAAVVTRSVDYQNRLQSLAIGGTGYVQHFAYAPDNLFATISNDEAVVTYTYADDRSETGYTLTLANGTTFTRSVTRDPNRPGLVTSVTNRCGLTVRGLSYTHDDLSRPTTRNDDTFGYNMRGEVSFAQISGNTELHTYDFSGNSTFAAFNTETNFFTANNLNQYSAISTLGAPAPLRETTPNYDSDGNLIAFGPWSYTYDSSSRLVSVSSNGVLLVTNAYDYRGRRVRKTTPTAVHTFIYDDWNLIRETVVYPTGSADVFEYFWVRDLSGSLQGAGGVGGLLYVKRNGAIYIPFVDANGNITAYADSTGAIVAEYVYDAFGRTSTKSGPLADVFRHLFSTKVFDVETGLYYYGCRFYHTILIRWLNRDPIEEDGGENLYAICKNSLIVNYDLLGLYVNLEYDVEKKTLTARDVDSGESITLREKVVSGNGKSCCVKADQWKSGIGPLLVGKYLVGLSYVPGQHASDSGDYNWYRLYGSNGKGGYTYNNIPVKAPDGTTVYRGGFNLHTGRTSDGCVTIWSDVERGDKGYPHSDDYDKLKAILDKTKPLRYKKSAYTGWLEVR